MDFFFTFVSLFKKKKQKQKTKQTDIFIEIQKIYGSIDISCGSMLCVTQFIVIAMKA